jgi:hypothetical protein
MPQYLLDFKNITNPSSIQKCLIDWSADIRKHSERTFELNGRDYNRTDLVRLYQFVGAGGHIFIYDYENGYEFFYQKRPKGRKLARAKDSDLDIQTLRCISEFLA